IPRGENIKELIPVKGKIYAITNAGIEILDLKADSTLNGELVTLPDSGIIQFNSFRLGNDALIIPYIMSGKSPEQISIGYYRFDITTRKLSRMTDLS
ncbi:hypothetical protein, partial [Escherichia coli]|uniref:hypothetical protein n=1 Tax=Escherichia coli TaxID=562 RepID=UPI00200E59FB